MARSILGCLLSFGLVASAAAIEVSNHGRIELVHHRYRLEMADGRLLTSLDAPVRRGSVLTFRRYPDGAITGVPAENVLRVESEVAAFGSPPAPESERPAGQPLRPGEVVDLGPTGDGAAEKEAPENAEPAAAPALPPWNGYYYGAGSYGGGGSTSASRVLLGAAVGVSAAPIGTTSVVSTTDLMLAQAAGTAAIASNGFPATSAPTVIGPNGFPVLNPALAGTSAPLVDMSGAPAVPGVPSSITMGSNGTPILTPSGEPGSTPPVIGSNGTPILAPGATVPTIGPNGTPILAAPGSPGGTPPAIGPNGTPVLAPGAAQPAPATAPRAASASRGAASH